MLQRSFFLKFWNSPTLMSWGSLASKLGGMLVLLPLLLHHFSPPDIVIWLLFGTIVSLQVIADIGFSQTFIRSIACAEGGLSISLLSDMRKPPIKKEVTEPLNVETLLRLVATMKHTYCRLTILAMSFLVPIGFYALEKPIEQSTNQESAWIASGIVLFTTVFSLWGNIYSAFLQGRNQVALLRRWEMLMSLAGIGTAVCVLLLGGNLLAVVIAQQIWLIMAVIRNYWLCKDDELFILGMKMKSDKETISAIWPSAWRSGVGVLMSFGIIQFSGMIYAQIAQTKEVSAYLLALRLIQTISQFSQAPFYSRLPTLAKLRSQGDIDEQLKVAKKGMCFSHLTFFAGFIIVGMFAQDLLEVIKSQSIFISPLLWSLLGLAFFLERFGAMHIQLYSTTNHIIWHVANGYTGLVMSILAFFLYPIIGVLAFPSAMIFSYCFIYSGIATYHSYRAFPIKVIEFELYNSILPFCTSFALWVIFLYLRG